MFFETAKPGAKVIATGMVRLLPAAATAPPVPDMLHWLLNTVLLPPGVTEPETNPVVLSLNKDSVLLAWV